jgi:hypothetical protein
MGLFSSSRSSTTNTQMSYADSFNQTTSNVANLSDVGNIALNLGGSDLNASEITKLMPLALIGAGVLIVGFVAASRTR